MPRSKSANALRASEELAKNAHLVGAQLSQHSPKCFHIRRIVLYEPDPLGIPSFKKKLVGRARAMKLASRVGDRIFLFTIPLLQKRRVSYPSINLISQRHNRSACPACDAAHRKRVAMLVTLDGPHATPDILRDLLPGIENTAVAHRCSAYLQISVFDAPSSAKGLKCEYLRILRCPVACARHPMLRQLRSHERMKGSRPTGLRETSRQVRA